MISRLTVYSALLSCIAGLAGCASTNLFKFRDTIPTESRNNPTVRILTMWQPSQGKWDNRTTRGVAGQVFFFGLNGDSPMQVDGEAVIDVFDDQGTPEEQARPFHTFRFPRDTWKAHLVKGPLGATYDVFIPYSRKGSHEVKMTLLVSYISKDGAKLNSEMVDVVLEGTKKPHAAEPGPAEYGHESGRARDSAKPAPASSANSRPPRTADLTLALPTAEELDRARGKIHAEVPLTAHERKRILREARDKQAIDEQSHVRHASYEEPAVETAGSAADDEDFDDLPQRRSAAAPSYEDRDSEISDDDWE